MNTPIVNFEKQMNDIVAPVTRAWTDFRIDQVHVEGKDIGDDRAKFTVVVTATRCESLAWQLDRLAEDHDKAMETRERAVKLAAELLERLEADAGACFPLDAIRFVRDRIEATLATEPQPDWCDVCNAAQYVTGDGAHHCGETGQALAAEVASYALKKGEAWRLGEGAEIMDALNAFNQP